MKNRKEVTKMKNVNAKLYAIKYKLLQKLTKSLDKDKEAIKNGAKITFDKFAKIQVVECTRKSYTKEAQAIIDKFAEEKGLEKVETKYLRVDIDNIDNSVEEVADKIINELEDSNDRLIQRVASKVADKK